MSKEPKQVSMMLPTELGTGLIRHTTTKNGIVLMDWQTSYLNNFSVYGPSQTEYLHLFVCLESGMGWEIRNKPGSVYINTDQSFIYRGHGQIEYARYIQNCNYHFVGFKIPWANLTEILHHFLSAHEIDACEKRLREVSLIPITSDIRQALTELMLLPKTGRGIEAMLLESRLMTLLSLYFSHLLEKEAALQAAPLSYSDRTALLELKQQIDMNPDFVPRCEALAHQVHMSISKFTRAFSAMFGMPVHTYVIQQRLEHATRLLLETDLTVSQVSARVGYAKPSNFSAAFKKRYGANPAAYKKHNLGKS